MRKILLINDQTLSRKGLVSLLSVQSTEKLVKEAGDKQEALLLIQSERPDLVIVDFYLGQGSGLDIIAEARQQGSMAKFVILTYSKDLGLFERARAMDIDGFISLNAEPEEFIYALQMIQRGRKYYDPDVFELLMNKQVTPQVNDISLDNLTMKETEVLQKLGMGFSNKQISESLFITENTVKKHVSQILAKLDLGDRTRAALYANEIGLVEYSSVGVN